MKKNFTFLSVLFSLAALAISAAAQGTPKIQFDETVFDFGKTSQVTTVSGIFKFKNMGDAILKVDPPKPSCGCTAAEVIPNTLAPGATGQIPFTLNLGFYRGNLEKHISVRSNDPLTPNVSLTIRVDYTPLYELTPLTLSPNLAYGMDQTNLFTTLARTDGKPLRVTSVETSEPWISASVVAEPAPTNTSARISIIVKRDGTPRRFNEYVHIHTADITNAPSSSVYLYGEMMGEVSLTPEALYWSLTANTPTGAPITQHINIRSASGRPLQVTNLQSSIPGITLKLVPQADGNAYDLIAHLEHVPISTISGSVSFETSVAAQSKIQVPVIVNVFKP